MSAPTTVQEGLDFLADRMLTLEALTSTEEQPAGTIDGVNDTFTLAQTPVVNFALFLNGLRQRSGAGNDFQRTGDTIVFEAAAIPLSGDTLTATYEY